MAAQPKLVGIEGRNVVFDVGGIGIAVDPLTKQTRQHSIVDVNGGAVLLPDGMGALAELAAAAAEAIVSEITIVAAGAQQRVFAVPKAVQAEAERGLALRDEHGYGGTAVGLSVAHTLVAGGQVDADSARHVARYFSARSGAKGTAGWRPGSVGYPSDERIGWSLWGGDAGQRWATKIAERIDVLTASAGDGLDELIGGDNELWAQFDGPAMEKAVALFARRPDDQWSVWSDGRWAECADPAGDPSLIYNPLCEIDDESAMYVAAALYDAPEVPVALSDVDPAEWEMMRELVFSIDADLLDSVMTAAAVEQTNWYSPEERSINAKKQPRDVKGKFVTVGATARHSSGQRVHVDGVRPSDGAVIVSDQKGTQYVVPSRELMVESKPKAPQPRPKGSSSARLPSPMTPMTPDQLHKTISDYESRVATHAAATTAAVEYPGGANDAIKPIYFAIVAPDDPQAVMELVALAPTVDGSKVTTSFKRENGAWVQDDAIAQDLKSPTPPPVVMLDGDLFDNVIAQVDATANKPSEMEEAKQRAERQIAESKDDTPIAAAGGIPDKSNVVLVAVPADDDPIWSASSEQVPHMTMLFFGQDVPPESLDAMHAAVAREAQALSPTTVNVIGRETLGDDEADVLMVEPDVFTQARDNLLQDPAIKTAYESTKQYPKWTPHVTLGYPPQPAKGVPGGTITFDKLALWEGEYQGDEYPLGYRPDNEPVDDMDALIASIQGRMLTPIWGVNDEILALVSAGGWDRNKGNAERLRRYWTVGKGGAKVAWNSPGDWRRCVRHLSRYLGPRAKGYCSLRHREMTGMWTGDKLHREMYGRR